MLRSRPEPPEDNGRRLATVRRGLDSELRVTLVEATDDRPAWVSIRAWARAEPTGEMWPRPGRYVGIDLAEVRMVAEGMLSAVEGPGDEDAATIRALLRRVAARSSRGGA